MRLCRYEELGQPRAGFYTDDSVMPLSIAARICNVELPPGDDLLPYLPGGSHRADVVRMQEQLERLSAHEWEQQSLPLASVSLLVPIARPPKLLLLAGNYAAHIEERGGRAAERARTFPYVFMKPPSTTLTHPGQRVRIPANSPDHIDWELELGVVMGRACRDVAEDEALSYVAGYTVVNDVSDRRFRPNPDRTPREKDAFFDWLHGKWHDTFCPLGPCVLPADELPDPQQLRMTLRVNGTVEQDGSTAEMVFPVAAVVSFISRITTLEAGDVISTGTPAGVGAAKGKFLKPGDLLEAQIERIGVLRNPVQ